MKTAGWILSVILGAFSLYWLSNLMLWYPWIVNPILGMVIMLTLGTALWAFGIFLCLKRFPGEKILAGAAITAVIMLLISMIADYIFFGLIRDAMEELYHPTTLYGYGFVLSLPFIEMLVFRKKLADRKLVDKKMLLAAAFPGIAAFLILVLVVI